MPTDLFRQDSKLDKIASNFKCSKCGTLYSCKELVGWKPITVEGKEMLRYTLKLTCTICSKSVTKYYDSPIEWSISSNDCFKADMWKSL